MNYEQARQARNDFVREYIKDKPWSDSVSMCNLVRKWSDKTEPWHIVVRLRKALPPEAKLPPVYKGTPIRQEGSR